MVPEAVTGDDIPDGGGHEELDAAATDALQSLLDGLGDIALSGAPEDEEAQPKLADETSGGTFDTETIPLFDEEALDQLRSAIGDEVYLQMLKLVPGESTRLLSDIQWALGAGDLSTARRYAHDLMGMAGNYAARKKSAGLERAIEETQRWLEKSA